MYTYFCNKPSRGSVKRDISLSKRESLKRSETSPSSSRIEGSRKPHVSPEDRKDSSDNEQQNEPHTNTVSPRISRGESLRKEAIDNQGSRREMESQTSSSNTTTKSSREESTKRDSRISSIDSQSSLQTSSSKRESLTSSAEGHTFSTISRCSRGESMKKDNWMPSSDSTSSSACGTVKRDYDKGSSKHQSSSSVTSPQPCRQVVRGLCSFIFVSSPFIWVLFLFASLFFIS